MIDAERFRRLADAAADGLKERGEIVSGALLAVLSGQSVFFYGPPGTAKSLIARRLSGCFKSSAFFECLMNRFTTPEELFGPISIHELKTADRYVRKTDGFLPSADFGFLDEIWKSSPAILNALLTILNERRFRNGKKVEKVPLKAIVAASNEIPPPGQGLEALYDRFIMRFNVPPVKTRRAFESILGSGGVGTDVEIAEEDKISNEEWASFNADIAKVKMSKDALNVIHAIRVKIQKRNAEKPDAPIYVSDRRWMKAVRVAKTAAAICGRDSVLPIDTLILPDCIWSRDEEREDVEKIVDEAVKEFGAPSSERLDAWEKEFSEFDAEVTTRAFWDRDVYDSVMAGSVECAKVMAEDVRTGKTGTIYIPLAKIGTHDSFHPLKKNGTENLRLMCTCDGDATFSVRDDGIANFGTCFVKPLVLREHQLAVAGVVETAHGGSRMGPYVKIKATGSSAFTIYPLARKGSLRELASDTIAKEQNTATGFKERIVRLVDEMEELSQVKASDYPFIPKKRLDVIPEAYSSCRQRAADDRIRCEYLIHRLNRCDSREF